ncbi:PilZ domain-containing protein [Pararobbsia alpina]
MLRCRRALREGADIEPTQNETPIAGDHDDGMDIAFGEPLRQDLADTRGVVVLKAGTVIPDETARGFLLEQFGPLTQVPPHEADPADVIPATAAASGATTARSPAGTGPATGQELGLEIGALLRLQPSKSTGLGALGCRVIGVAPNDSIFITPPTTDGQNIDLVFGERLNAVYVSRRAVFGFVCTVQSTFRQPFPYVLLSPPGPITRLRARSALRARVRFFALVGHAPTNALSEFGIIRNLSASGLNLSAREGLAAINDVIRVSFCIHTIGRDHMLDLHGRVRHVRRDENPGHVSYGLHLQDLSAHDRLLLSYHVLEQSELER